MTMLERPGWNWDSHRLGGEGCCSGEAADDKTGVKAEEEDGHGHQLRII